MPIETKLNGNIGGAANLILRKLGKAMAVTTVELQSHVRETNFGNSTTANRLKNRTGQLRNSVRAALPVKYENDTVGGGLMFGKIYASTHVGPKGGEKVIKPKKKKWLTIPITNNPETVAFLFTSAGQLRHTAQSIKSVLNTYVYKGVIFGRKPVAVAGKVSKKKDTPLFVLKKEVRIPYRIHPKDIFKWFREKFAAEVAKQGLISGNPS